MPADTFKDLPRAQRRKLLDAEARARKSGEWGPWETIRFPPATIGTGWAGEFTISHRNKVFAVLDRTTIGEGVRHLAVSSLSGIRPSFLEMQRIKDELCGPHFTGVEIYPPARELVNAADMFHIWCFTGQLPFGLADRNQRPPKGVEAA